MMRTRTCGSRGRCGGVFTLRADERESDGPVNVIERILFAVTCLVVPILWGLLVDRIFDAWRARDGQSGSRETSRHDYQI